MKKSSFGGRVGAENGDGREGVVWEMRPGGMLVQKREDVDGASESGTMIKIKVYHGSSQHVLSLPAQSTFGSLKRFLAQETGLEPREQRLLFRGKEKEDHEWLHMVGVKDMAKVLLMEDPASKERKLDEMKKNQGVVRACEAVNKVRAEVNKLAEKVTSLESSVLNGAKVAEKEFNVLTELLMVQLLNLDGIEAEGEAKVQRRIADMSMDILKSKVPRNRTKSMLLEAGGLKRKLGTASRCIAILGSRSFFSVHFIVVLENDTTGTGIENVVRCVQGLVETLDSLKARNANPLSAATVSTKWETFESGLGSLQAPTPLSSSRVTQDWEQFD
ncbi:hypothetical protein Sjap_014171 [Stephania japonica]|uniref:Uncharacterized protein n=1 Tax=Stephania japonica TaxID=461633 RepID=A0AAP0NZQ7_9MAGN